MRNVIILGEDNFFFCCAGSRENGFRSVFRQNNSNNHNVVCIKSLFFMYFIEILKEKNHIRRNINCKKERSFYVKSVLLLF